MYREFQIKNSFMLRENFSTDYKNINITFVRKHNKLYKKSCQVNFDMKQEI